MINHHEQNKEEKQTENNEIREIKKVEVVEVEKMDNEAGKQGRELVGAQQSKLSSFSDLFIAAIKWWWKNIVTILLLYWQAALELIIPLVLAIALVALNYFVFKWPVLYGSIVLALKLFIIYFYLRVNISIFLLVKHQLLEKKEASDPLDPKTFFTTSRKLFIPYFLLNLLLAVILLAWFLIPALVVITFSVNILGLSLASILFLVVLALIPGIVMSILYSLSTYVFFVEDKRGWQAIKASYHLTKNYFWPLVGRFILLSFVFLLVEIVIKIFLELFMRSPEALNLAEGIYIGLALLIAPISVFFLFKVYQELKQKN